MDEGIEGKMSDIKITFDKGIRRWLIEKGATQAQYNSKTVDWLEQAMTDGEISVSATAKEHIASLQCKVEQANAKTDSIAKKLGVVEDRYNHAIELLEQTERSTREKTISNGAIIDGVNAFGRMLESVRDIFGEESMTESVICAAINAASYGYWRSIMGPKSAKEARYKFDDIEATQQSV